MTPTPEPPSAETSNASDSEGSLLRNRNISRRTLLKAGGIGSVGALGGLAAYSRFSHPQPTRHQVDTLDLPKIASRPTSAVVIGAGLAGLAAAYELSKRGVQVTLIERSPQLGGKIASWPITVNGYDLRMEHGFHGFFPQYYNLFSLLEELDARDNLRSLDFYSVIYKDDPNDPKSPHYNPEVFYPSHSAFPWNIVDLTFSSSNLFKWGLNLTQLKQLELFKEIVTFSIPQTYDRLDQYSLDEWSNGQFPKGLNDLYFIPFAKSSLNAPDVLSAGELMQFFHFYFFGNPEGLAFNGTRQDMGRCIVDPLSNAIQANGGRILTSTTVSRINWENNRITSVEFQRRTNLDANPKSRRDEPPFVLPDASTNTQTIAQTDAKAVPFWVDRNLLLSDDQTDYYGAGDNLYAIAKTAPKQALSLTCTHQGCSVHKQVAADGNGFVCPCHGAAYDDHGHVTGGPAQTDLAQFEVIEQESSRVRLKPLKIDAVATQAIQADYYIIAADIPGTQALMSLSAGNPNATVLAQVNELQTADPFAVARFWFDRPFTWDQSWFTSISGYRLTDSITIYHEVQDDYKQWAEVTGGSVVELQSYGYKEKEFPDQQSILETFESELYDIVPALKGATRLHRELVNQKNFAGFPPGSYANRPATTTPVPNLIFAGDWVKMPFPCGLMERAVSSGLLAANAALQKEGIARRPVLSVNPKGIVS